MDHSPVRSKENFLVFGAPQIEESEILEVVDSMRSGWLGTGPKAARFESDFMAYKNATHAIAICSCTAALHLAILAANIGPGDEVITTPMTFCATVNAIIHSGATPVLADIDPATLNIDPAAIKAAITPRTRAIIPVHFAGRPCDMDTICDIAARHNLTIIEDCAHAIETTYKGHHTGSFGDFGCFSFYATKNVATGEGGMITAKSEPLAARIKMLALHGMTKDAWNRFSDEGYKHYYVVEAGFKYNMPDLTAAIGIHQLARVEANLVRREQIWQAYDDAFANLPVTTPAPAEPDTRHARHLYTILIDPAHAGISRDDFLTLITRENIGAGVHYLAIPEHPLYQKRYGWRPDDFPHALAIGRHTVSLPISPKLSDNDVADVITAVRKILGAQ